MDDNSFGTYRELAVWQKAVQLVKLVYGQVKEFPADEKYALSDQIRRAVVSIPSNVAEGNGRASNKDYAHFLSIARGSLFETMNHLDLLNLWAIFPIRTKLKLLPSNCARCCFQ